MSDTPISDEHELANGGTYGHDCSRRIELKLNQWKAMADTLAEVAGHIGYASAGNGDTIRKAELALEEYRKLKA